MDCIQCGEEAKYKCPTCREPYCSVPCCKLHKETPCSAPSPETQDTTEKFTTEYEYPTEDTVPPEKLKLLEQSKELRKCLENPSLREILETLDSAPYPDLLMSEYMLEPIFTEFVDACLKTVDEKNV
ncbi:unnamed protein product, partial [Brenthis ino]